MNLTRVSLPDADADALIAQLNAELRAAYPEEGANHFRLDPDEVGPGRGAFLIARLDGLPVGCGAVRLIEPGRCEVKRMFTSPAARGRGVAHAVLRELERAALELGATMLVLETGPRQTAALALYRDAGFKPVPAWGEYVGCELSVCLGKALR